VVGYCNSNAGGETAFIWDADHGMRSLESVLVNDYGVDLGGWSLSNAKDVSADGRVIVGYGHNANRDSEAFLAQVPGPTPPIADADGPYTIWVGDPLILNAAQSTDPDPDGEIISYVWDLDGDGVFETNAGDQPFFVVDYEDVEDFGLTVGGMYDIHLQVTDNTGLTHTDSSSLRVIPEPAALSLLTLGGLALLRRRKRGMCK
jgi:hypothetical protein